MKSVPASNVGRAAHILALLSLACSQAASAALVFLEFDNAGPIQSITGLLGYLGGTMGPGVWIASLIATCVSWSQSNVLPLRSFGALGLAAGLPLAIICLMIR